jgi:hypothetical protein
MKARAKADPCGMTTRKAEAMAGTTAKATATAKDNSRFLHFAPHDEAVRRCGRNDDSWIW